MAPDVLDEAVPLPGFETIRRLGRGGMGVVYLARQVSLNRQVAIKILPPLPRAESAARAERFRREAELMARVSHPNVVSVYDFGVADGRPYLVMEYVAGGDLKRSISADRPLEPGPRARPDCPDRAGPDVPASGWHPPPRPEAREYPHEGRADAEGRRLRHRRARGLDGHPERPGAGDSRVRGAEQQYGLKVDERCDQYSLAAVAYELLTGRRPLGTSFEPPSRYHRGLSKEVDEAIMRGLSDDRDDRFATVEEFAETLDRALAGSLQRPLAPGLAGCGGPRRAGPRRGSRRPPGRSSVARDSPAPRGPVQAPDPPPVASGTVPRQRKRDAPKPVSPLKVHESSGHDDVADQAR